MIDFKRNGNKFTYAGTLVCLFSNHKAYKMSQALRRYYHGQSQSHRYKGPGLSHDTRKEHFLGVLELHCRLYLKAIYYKSDLFWLHCGSES
jgi:hypothetical protein